MADRLLLDILNKIYELPPGHVRQLKRHLDVIEGALNLPQQRATAE